MTDLNQEGIGLNRINWSFGRRHDITARCKGITSSKYLARIAQQAMIRQLDKGEVEKRTAMAEKGKQEKKQKRRNQQENNREK